MTQSIRKQALIATIIITIIITKVITITITIITIETLLPQPEQKLQHQQQKERPISGPPFRDCIKKTRR